MAHAKISVKPADIFRFKNLLDKSKILMESNIAISPGCVGHSNAAGFLSPVLQRTQAVVDRCRHIISGKVINAKNTALLMNAMGLGRICR